MLNLLVISNVGRNLNKRGGQDVLQEKRTKTKKLNSSKNKKNSKVMREKIFNMEQERTNLMKQADVLKKRDASIDNLMDKYMPKSNKKTKAAARSGGLMSKIKERMINVEKGKSIEIKESKRGKEQRLMKERQRIEEELENEGGEKEETKIQSSTKKRDHDDSAEGENLFDEEEQDNGDQIFNESNVPKALKWELDKEAEEKKHELGKSKFYYQF